MYACAKYQSALLAGGLLCLAVVGTAWAETLSDTTTSTLTTCPVTGQQLGEMGDPVVREIVGREVRFCCAGCEEPYRAKLEEYGKKVDDLIIAQEKDRYPLATCVVSGDSLSAMGKPYDYVYGNRLIRFCCEGCVDTFKKDPAKYIAKLDTAVTEKQKPAYPSTTCPVSGRALGEHPVDLVIGNRLIELCGKGCVAEVKKNPAKYLSMLDNAAPKAK